MKSTVADYSHEAQEQIEAGAKARALMKGTDGMREAGKKYLPKFPAETEEAYQARLSQSWLFNGFRKTVRDMAGRVFAKPIEIVQADARLAEWSLNIDNAGNDLSTFSRRVFEAGLAEGITYIMADAPPRNGVVTVAQAEALRPYLVHIETKDVLGWKTAVVNGKPVLTQLRLMECVHEDKPDDEFAQVEVKQVRVLDRTEAGVQVRIYRKMKDAGGREDWQLWSDPAFTGLSEITVVPFCANPDDFFSGRPLLDDLADANIAHWQSQSDQRQILHYARVPILFAAGRSQDDGPIEVSASTAVISSDPTAKLQWVEHSGQAIGVGRQDLKDLEFQMEAHGLQMLVARPGGQSATGEALDAAKETSLLAMTADELKTSLEVALGWMAEYGGVDETVEIAVNKEFGVNMMAAQDVTALLSAVNTGQMPTRVFVQELIRRGTIDPGTDIENYMDELSADTEKLMSASQRENTGIN
jgi:hypothetical protein